MVPRMQHAWVDPTARWGIDTARHGLLMMWDHRADGWYGFVLWVEVGARAHGGSPRSKLDWLPAACIRAVDGPTAPTDFSWVKPMGTGDDD
ncbi:hypothetical protein [Nocardioides sp. ChNu-99]|uniref:hypothetical protein n=1 Tax=Nocardioides sp. ChNu-99 TaxID=2839897 RepID=UPI0024061AD0|nr:hypothetical protein [Nocardioides sp. ChNu-99]MDF9715847.1 hypothetical protein [Nocardioides sp. ChNu-99]